MTATTHTWGSQPEMFGPRHEHRLGMIVREVERITPGGRVLDGAVGLGQLAGRMQQRGYRVTGIDYSFQAALHVKKTHAAARRHGRARPARLARVAGTVRHA